jgi:hypothetical protein
VRSGVFGLMMDAPLVKKFIEEYYQCCSLGTPFLSCFPEEFVLTAIAGQEPYSSWKTQPFRQIFGNYFSLCTH